MFTKKLNPKKFSQIQRNFQENLNFAENFFRKLYKIF